MVPPPTLPSFTPLPTIPPIRPSNLPMPPSSPATFSSTVIFFTSSTWSVVASQVPLLLVLIPGTSTSLPGPGLKSLCPKATWWLSTVQWAWFSMTSSTCSQTTHGNMDSL
ncbi:hypothetical protein HMI56_007017, partial [Coelomomyces lativittatus]